MASKLKKYGIPLTVLVVGNGILVTTWWVNGAQVEDLWLYILGVFFVCYGASELYSGLSKHYKNK